MRTVIDTGVFVSAAIKAQTPPSAAVHLAVVRGVLLKSRSTEAELMEVIDRPYLARLIAAAACPARGIDDEGRIGLNH
jgi:predicted nucleic acid-binding protein